MGARRKVCLVSPGHACSDPRLVKSAHALHEAGYEVHVVCGWYFPPYDALDREIFRLAPWARTVVYTLTGPRVTAAKVLRELARRRLRQSSRCSLRTAMRAQHHAVRLLGKAASRTRSDLYIGHCLAGLSAAALAAEDVGAPYAFDAEDFHSAETEYAQNDPALNRAIQIIESSLLPGCRHITAAAPLIAEAYAKTYGVPLPTTVLNVFPRAEAPVHPHPGTPDRWPPRLYWFSQSIGPGRGLRHLIAALARMKTRCDLHVRGLPVDGFSDALFDTRVSTGYSGEIEILPPAAASEMSRLCADCDLGLALEHPYPLNHDLCLANKIFTYLLAGLPVALTPTQGQQRLAQELGEAAVNVDLKDPARTAAVLDSYFGDPVRRQRARSLAWQLGQNRFNWDVEKQVLLNVVETSFHSAPSRGLRGNR